MKHIQHRRPARPFAAFSAIGACLALAVACSSATDEQPTQPITPATIDGSIDTGTTTPITVPDGNVPDPGLDASIDRDAAGCTTDAGCFSCEPETLPDFLNECTDEQCEPFDNVARLPLYVPGQALPDVP